MERIELTPVFVPEHEQYVRVYKRVNTQNGKRERHEVYIPFSILEKLDIRFGDKIQVLEDQHGNLYLKKTENGVRVTGERRNKTRRINSRTIVNRLLGNSGDITAKYLCEVVEINGNKLISICNKVNHVENGKH